ncbi:carboxypeptidase-like regulatory domain-containing protein [Tundrisphaera lichenicola]|uniref:carboxypeptidase-like regulatory domain-containing protein n=1 Tax=Tundrisphaera lichenicola TaxID=2029860 RepID=UPI003EB79ED4
MLTLAILMVLAQDPQPAAAQVADPGWPTGAAQIFNHPGRLGWHEKSGRWTSDYRGKIPADVFEQFVKLETYKRIVLHDPRESLGWSFTTWQTKIWESAPGTPDIPVKFGETIAQIDLYGEAPPTKDMIVVDRRMRGHAPGNVLEGDLTDTEGRPLVGKVILQDNASCRTAPYTVAQTETDAKGHWVLRHATPSTYRVIAEAEGHLPRVVDYLTLDDEPQYKPIDCVLARPVPVSGRVTDDAGHPFPGGRVYIREVMLDSGDVYESPEEFTAEVDTNGLFVGEVPAGKATVWPYCQGWCSPILSIKSPASGIALKFVRTSEVRVTVEFPGQPVDQYRISIEPDGEKVAGMHDQWAHAYENRKTFHDVQPGRYIIRGRPESDEGGEVSTLVELKSGKKVDVVLRAR